MKKPLVISLILVFATASLAGDLSHSKSDFEVRYTTANKRLPDMYKQQKLRERAEWVSFMHSSGGNWQVIFNEESGKPHNAYGSPIFVSGNSPDSKARSFINTHLYGYRINWNNFQLSSTPITNDFQNVNYYQTYSGIRVLNSRIMVKMTPFSGVVGFGLHVFDITGLNTSPALGATAAISASTGGITDKILSTVAKQELFVLPVPSEGAYSYHLVYEIMVYTIDGSGIPANFKTLVDAHSGKILSRTNTVMHVAGPPANTDVNMSGTIYPTHVYNPSATLPLVNMRINANSQNYYTDNTGFLGLTNTTPTSATFYLEGLWCDVNTNNVTPSFTGTLNPGVNNVSFNANANIRELSGYYHVNMVHDYMKSWFPTFPSMDNPLTTNIDVNGSCNAFYNGPSINFFMTDATCNCLSQCADVVYHEYGHGISDKFYQWQSASFDNGAMGEGYSDVWGCSITQSPLLGVGFYVANQTPIRRYDINPKRYPENIVGEVHADGEIIAGAWWDVSQLLSINYMNKLFTDTHWDLVTGPDGSEGQVFYDILIAALQADDVVSNGGDNNICNGTPNGVQIKQGFANHGITLITNVNLTHTPVLSAPAGSPISIPATINNSNFICGVAGGVLFWRTDDVSAWNQVNMTGTPPSLTGTIPAQTSGTIVRYYIAVTDNQTTIANVMPIGADNTTNPNIPFYILVDFIRFAFDDFENFDTNNPTWYVGGTGDNATTGVWEFANPPVASYLAWPDPNTIVQPGVQHTSGGTKCFVTENTSSSMAGAGAEDVDGGKTTLETSMYDLTSYTTPAVSYWRWYSNDQGATPGTDYWQVYISNDNGATWDTLEFTTVSDHSYRRFVFKPADYVPVTNQMVFRFVAEDANAGSLIEAAVDDLEIWDLSASGVEESSSIVSFFGYPNPTNGSYTLNYGLNNADEISLEVLNHLGQLILFKDLGSQGSGLHTEKLDMQHFAEGLYFVRMNTGKGSKLLRINVIR